MTTTDPLVALRECAADRYIDPGMLAGVLAAVLTRRHALLIGRHGLGKLRMLRVAWAMLPDVDPVHPLAPWSVTQGGAREFNPRPPLRAPHHTASMAGFLGGGTPLREGELTLATDGVLLLDELPEIKLTTQQAIAQALEDGYVAHYRKGAWTRFKVRTTMVASTTSCPCGFNGDEIRACVCPPSAITRWRARVEWFACKVPAIRRIDPTPLALWDVYRARMLDLLRRSEVLDVFASPNRALEELALCDPRNDTRHEARLHQQGQTA